MSGFEFCLELLIAV